MTNARATGVNARCLACIVLLVALCLVSGCVRQDSQDNVEVRFTVNEPTGLVVVEAVVPGRLSRPDNAADWLKVHALDARDIELPAMLGDYAVDPGRIVFTPRFTFAPGATYRARLTLPGRPAVQAEYTIPVIPQAAAIVESISPAGSVLPANHLKFYLRFSRPMLQGREIFTRIRLLDEQGHAVVAPWRESELWSRDYSMLTLWIHPGRVKRELSSREQMGPVLEPGRAYTLEISDEVRDSDGGKLAAPFTKEFSVEAEDRARPLPEAWKLSSPLHGTREPLAIDFGEALEAELARECIKVQGPDGATLAGEFALLSDERGAIFTPTAAWRAAEHRLKVSVILEDLAGNRPDRLFDVGPQDVQPPPPKLGIAFCPP